MNAFSSAFKVDALLLDRADAKKCVSARFWTLRNNPDAKQGEMPNLSRIGGKNRNVGGAR